jgi:putative membrane protein
MSLYLLHPIRFVIALLCSGAAVMLVAHFLPTFTLKKGFRTALVVALVYGLLKTFLQGVLVTLTLPFIILSMGLFYWVINTFLLWLTDKILSDFEVKDTKGLFVGSALLSLCDLLLHAVVKHGAIF